MASALEKPFLRRERTLKSTRKLLCIYLLSLNILSTSPSKIEYLFPEICLTSLLSLNVPTGDKKKNQNRKEFVVIRKMALADVKHF